MATVLGCYSYLQHCAFEVETIGASIYDSLNKRCQEQAVSKYYVITSSTSSLRSTAVVGTDVRASPNSSKVVIAMVTTDSHRQFVKTTSDYCVLGKDESSSVLHCIVTTI